jgi:hypothetical protein
VYPYYNNTVSPSNNYSQGKFLPGVSGFAGFFLPNGDFGWIDLKWGKFALGRVPDTFTLGEWAYNDTPYSSITAGEVPEPGTLPLALLGLGWVGVVA